MPERTEPTPSPDGSSVSLWTVAGWLKAVPDVPLILARAILGGKKDGESEQEFFFRMSDNELQRAIGAQCLDEIRNAVHLTRANTNVTVTASELNEKFCHDTSNFEFTYDSVDALHAGLEAKIGNPSPNAFRQMEWEHTMGPLARVPFNFGPGNQFTTTPLQEWTIVLNGCTDVTLLGGREPVKSLDFIIEQNPEYMKGRGKDPSVGLVREEVLGGILYTGYARHSLHCITSHSDVFTNT